MAAKRVFGKIDLTREEREADRRIWEATKDEPSPEEFERRLGPGVPVADPETVVSRLVIAHKLRVAREKAALTKAELAERLGTDEESISRIESGDRNLTLEALDKLARALGLRLSVDLAPQK